MFSHLDWVGTLALALASFEVRRVVIRSEETEKKKKNLSSDRRERVRESESFVAVVVSEGVFKL